MKIQNSLFLHWGPGGNASMERLWFGESVAMDWWDQPTSFVDEKRALAEVFDAAAAKLDEKFEAAGKPVPLVAHCFGGMIAAELVRRSPARVASLVLLSSGTSPARGFLRFAERLIRKARQNGDAAAADALEGPLSAARLALSAATFWPLFGAITTMPGFMDEYWGNREAQKRHAELLPRAGAPIHPQAFQALMNDLLARGDSAVAQGAIADAETIPVRLLMGDDDPLYSVEEEGRNWRRLFPHARIETEKGIGHFAHLELPVERWLG